jgi:hypothetical protein
MAIDADAPAARTGRTSGMAEAVPHRGPWALVGHVLRHPAKGWRAVARAPVASAALLVGVAAPLAAIGPAARLVRTLIYGDGSTGIIEYRPTTAGALATALVGWAAALVAVALLALAIDLAAPLFDGTRDRARATRVAVYGSTPWWLASGFAVLPAISVLQVLGAYALLLLFNGTTLLMRGAKERGTAQGATSAVGGVVLLIATLLVTGAVGRSTLRQTVKTATGWQVVTGTPALTGVDLTAPANDKRGAVAPGIAAAAAARGAVPASSLQELLPVQVGPFRRTAVESQSNLSAGVASADAKATYVQGTDSFTLTISDAGTPGALATDNSVIAGEVNRVTDSGYQRSRVVNGVRTIEKWSNADHGGAFSRAVAGRFTVEARGVAPTIDTLKSAVGAVDTAKLSALAR